MEHNTRIDSVVKDEARSLNKILTFSGTQRWITTPFWWRESSRALCRGDQRVVVSPSDMKMLNSWREPHSVDEIATMLGIGIDQVAANCSRFESHGLLVPIEQIQVSIPAVELELSSRCNANCVMCPRDTLKTHRGFKDMSQDVFDALLKNLGGRGIPTYYLCGIGEPLLHPHCLQFAQKLREADPNSKIVCTTNGFSINPDALDSLIHSSIDILELSIHSLDTKIHQSIMRGFRVERALERIEALLKRLEKSSDARLDVHVGQVLISMHSQPDRALEAWARERGLKFNVWRTWNRAGHVPESILTNPSNESESFDGANRSPDTCSDYANVLFIDHRGDVLSCCCDMANETTELNATQHSFEEILANRIRNLASGRPLSSICPSCDAPATNKPFCTTDYYQVLLANLCEESK